MVVCDKCSARIIEVDAASEMGLTLQNPGGSNVQIHVLSMDNCCPACARRLTLELLLKPMTPEQKHRLYERLQPDTDKRLSSEKDDDVALPSRLASSAVILQQLP